MFSTEETEVNKTATRDVSKLLYLFAGKPTISTSDLARLSTCRSAAVRRRIAEHPRCPLELLTRLSVDEDIDVRAAVALHPRTPPSLAARLCADDSVDLRYEMASMPQLPFVLLDKLAHDDNPYVSERAEKTIKMIDYEKQSAAVERARIIEKPEKESALVRVLKDCSEALCWVKQSGMKTDVPENLAPKVKQLENLGIVFKRNNKTFEIRRQRLRKLIANESKGAGAIVELNALLEELA